MRAGRPSVMLLAIACLLFVAGCMGDKGKEPTPEEIAERLREGDVSGQGIPYRVDFEFTSNVGPTPTSQSGYAIIDAAHDEILINAGALSFHYKGDQVASFIQGETYIGRDYGRRLSEEGFFGQAFGEAAMTPTVTKTASRTYLVRWDPDVEGMTISVDKEGRFSRMRIQTGNETALDAAITYDSVSFPSFPTTGTRVPAQFEVPVASPQTVFLDDLVLSVRPDELEMRFLDPEGNVLRSVGFGQSLDEDGYTFAFADTNANGLVDEEDSFSFGYPGPDTTPRVFDTWAQRYTDEEVAPRAPGLAWLGAILALFVEATLIRRRMG